MDVSEGMNLKKGKSVGVEVEEASIKVDAERRWRRDGCKGQRQLRCWPCIRARTPCACASSENSNWQGAGTARGESVA